MSVELARDAGPAEEQVLAALAEHLPPGVMGRPLVIGDGMVIDVHAHTFGTDEHGAWRIVSTAGGAHELTCWHRGAETRRTARGDLDAGEAA